MDIVAASAEDCRAVAQVHVASWQAAYAGILDAAFLADLSVDRREQAWREVLSERRSDLLLARRDGQVIGFSSFGAARDADAPPGRGELWALYLHPDAWSGGAGRRLWQATHQRLAAQGFSSVSLWVLERNARAIAFYSAVGFAVEAASAKDFELGGTRVREVRMIRAG